MPLAWMLSFALPWTLAALSTLNPTLLRALEEIPLATSTLSQSTDSSGQVVVALPGGGFAAVWVAGSFGDSFLQMQWLDADGEVMFEADGKTLAEGVESATLVANPSGGVFVAFGGSFAQPDGITIQSFDADGDPQWPGEGVSATNLEGLQSSSFLVPDTSGGVFTCFSLSFTEEIRCQHLDAKGNRLWPAEGIAPSTSPGAHARPRGIADPAGGLMVFWRNQRDPNDGQTDTMLMEGQRLSSAGARLWGDDGVVVRDTFLPEGSSFYHPDFFDVHEDGAGGAVLTFEAQRNAVSNAGIIAQRVAADGSLLWGDGTVVVDDAASTQHRAAIQPHDGGIVVISSEDVGKVTTRLRMFRLDAEGEHLWPTEGVLLSDPLSTGHNFHPEGSFDKGILRVAWTFQLADSPFEMDISLARFRPDGTRLDTQLVTDAPIVQTCSAVTYSEETDTFLILWDDLRSNNFENSDIYAAKAEAAYISADGFELGDTSAWSWVVP